jgi:hypothetical protein
LDSILAQRLGAQRITGSSLESAHDVVAWLGAVQAQDYLASKWAVGLRMRDAVDAAIERAVGEGSILRVHAFRGTWQYVVPEDVRWMLALVGPRVIARSKPRYDELGLDARTLVRASEIVANAVRAGPLVRSEIASALRRAGISPDERLSHILARAELDGLICSGPRRGKQSTHVLLDARAPAARPVPRDEALARLAQRYFQSRSPATLDDFVWWSGLPVADGRAAHASVRHVVTPSAIKAPRAFLLPAFDEYLIAYRDRSAMIAARHVPKLDPRGGILEPVIVLDGRVVGGWSRTLQRDSVSVSLRLFIRPNRRERAAIDEAVSGYARFLGLANRTTLFTAGR